ncbi:MAG TPA: hypothetical protein VJB70_00860 [Candidatus Paceibacterota bacterium]
MLKYILLFVVIIVGVVWYSGIIDFSKFVPEQEPVVSGDVAEPEGAGSTMPVDPVSGFARLEANALYIAEQWPGKELVANIVNLESPGYVAIHELVDGKPGAIIGSSALIKDVEGKNVKVVLKRAVKDGEEFMAMLHNEKGGGGFDPAVDLPVLGRDGSPIHMMFQVNAEASDPSKAEIMF